MKFLPYILRRATRHWQVLLPLILGVIIATGLLASGPLLVNTIMDFAMSYKLRSGESLDTSFRLTTYSKVDEQGYAEVNARIEDLVSNRFREYLSQSVGAGSTFIVYPWVDEQLLTDKRLIFSFYEGLPAHIELISGEWPQEVLGGEVVSGLIGTGMAENLNLQVGDRLPLSYKVNESGPALSLEVAGVIQAIDIRDPYWLGAFNPLRINSDQRNPAQYSVLLPQNSFFDTANALFPDAHIQLNWNILLDPDRMHSQDSAVIISRLEALRTDLSNFESRVALETNIEDVLNRFISQAEAVRVPLYLLILEVLFLALYYVSMLAALSTQQVESEFATLSSRGASKRHLLTIQILETLLISGIALLSGPGLAYLLVGTIARLGPLKDISQSEWILILPKAAWIATGTGAIACILGLLFPVFPALKRSVVAHQRRVARTPGAPWWQRYYLDVFILLAGLILLWRLNLYGGISGGSGGGVQVDWLLLLSPLALLVGSATILLRVFPVVTRLSSNWIARGRGIAAPLAFWQTARNPTHVARLVLLLTLATALGILSTGLNATLDTSESERAEYAVGGDVRLVFDQFPPLGEFNQMEAVSASSAVWRSSGTVDVRTKRIFPKFDLLAIEPFSFSAVSKFRQDFADHPISLVMGYLATDPSQYPVITIPLPGKPSWFGFWISDVSYTQHPVDPMDYLIVKAKFQTAQGKIIATEMALSQPPGVAPVDGGTLFLPMIPNIAGKGSTLDGPVSSISLAEKEITWSYFDAVLPELPEESYPLALHSLWFKIRPLISDSWFGEFVFLLDDIGVSGSLEEGPQIIEDFEGTPRIWQTSGNSGFHSRFTQRLGARSGEASLMLNLSSSLVSSQSLSPAQSTQKHVLPAVVSQGFLDSTSLTVGDELIAQVDGIRIPFIIQDVINYFPTLYEDGDRSFLITARDPLLAYINNLDVLPMNFNEVWATTPSQEQSGVLLSAFSNAIQALDIQSMRRLFKADPLSLGLRSVTFLGYILTSGLSLIGFATHFYMSARQRAVVYGILRSLGLSPRQLYASLVLEQLLLIFTGLALGTLLGLLLNQLTLPGLPISLGDRPPVPPFIPQQDWIAIARLYLGLTAAFLGSLGVATLLLWRSRLHRILRIGQE